MVHVIDSFCFTLLQWMRTTDFLHATATLPRQFLGYSFPTVRQATAQSLYIRFLEVPKLQKKTFTQPQGGPQLVTNAVITPLNSLLNMGFPGVK